MDGRERARIVALIRSQVVPAVGCTEPVAVALCVARACELLRGGVLPVGMGPQEARVPENIDVRLSANILKNALGVGIPGTGMVGLPIAVALGALVGRSADGLEVLGHVTEDAVDAGRRIVQEGRIQIGLCEADCPKLYIEVCVRQGADSATAVIAHSHTRFVRLERNGNPCPLPQSASGTDDDDVGAEEGNCVALDFATVYAFATTAPLEEIDFINEAGRLNVAAAEQALRGTYGHDLGKTLTRPLGKGIMGESIFSHIIATTASACDARMAGAPIPVMSNSGSGNQGICATVPVVVFARENHNTGEELTRALVLSHLTAIYIKQSLGTLSALCGCVVASTGSSVGITYLMGGTYAQLCASVKNMVANLTGMICDGAKPSCALKLSSGVSTAVLSSLLAMQGHCVSAAEGIIDDDVDKSIRNLTRIGHDAMDETDRCVLDIMVNK